MKRFRKKRKKKLIILSALLFIGLGIYAFTASFVRPVIRTVSEDAIKSFTVDSVNASVIEVMSVNPIYDDLIEIVKDNDGNITLIRTNSSAVNALARGITQSAQRNLEQIGEQGIGIPIGSLSGISFFAGRGPDVKIKAIPVGSIDTNFSSQFIPAGINQTLHRLFIDVTASVSIVIPGAENKVTTLTQVLIGESVIIGKVPDVYFNAQTTDKTYDFVP